MMTTTAVDLDDELLSRCLVLAVDESPEQTRRIHEHQRAAQTVEGVLAHERRAQIVRLHHDAQRLLRPIRVVQPPRTGPGFADLRVRARRDHRKLLALVEVIALLHQHQRPVRVVEAPGCSIEVIDAHPTDVDLAHELIALVTPGLDELPLHTRRVLDLLDVFVDERARNLGIHRDRLRFGRREVSEHTGLGPSQLKVHLRRLVDAELVLVHAAAHGRGVSYSLAYDSPRPDTSRAEAGPGPAQGRGVDGPGHRGEIVVASPTCATHSSSPSEPRASGHARTNTYANDDPEAAR